jgi:hypothetical protein
MYFCGIFCDYFLPIKEINVKSEGKKRNRTMIVKRRGTLMDTWLQV